MAHLRRNQLIINAIKKKAKSTKRITYKDLRESFPDLTQGRLSYLVRTNEIKVYRVTDKYEDEQLRIGNLILKDKKKLRASEYAKLFKVSESTIRIIFERYDIASDEYKTIVNDYFHHIDSYEKAYFLGLLMGDGCVNKDYNTVTIALHHRDSYILERLHKVLKLETKMLFSDKTDKRDAKLSISFSSPQIKEDLKDFSVTPQKTFTTTFPDIEKINKQRGCVLPKEAYKKIYIGFLLGLLDSDGYMTFTTGYERLIIGFLGTQDLLEGVNEYLSKELDLPKRNVRKHSKDANVQRVEWTAKIEVKKVVDYLYKNIDIKKDIHMTRKYDKAKVYLDRDIFLRRDKNKAKNK